ncbi:MAG: DUF465 domain-containing protein [Neisseriaceae bacterium]|nr:DUF465 domain-containing protein [Neisseriaceae bacterium]MBP6863353.1 DUF465 domain-containing protein [Neisseriaceae bacterium]
MFPEYRELISKLKSTQPRFQSLFEKHNALDHEIIRLEKLNADHDQIIRLKREKLNLKDQLYVFLQSHDATKN